MTDFADLIPAPQGRFDGIQRPYSPEDVLRLRGSVPITHTLAERGANKLWELLHTEDYINALGAVTGNQSATISPAQTVVSRTFSVNVPADVALGSVITVTGGTASTSVGQAVTVVLTPTLNTSNGVVTWACTGTPAQYMPSSCRA